MIGRRERDSRRVAKSVRSHEATMAALTPAKKEPKSIYGKKHEFYDQEKDK
jgi:hypothetical protein